VKESKDRVSTALTNSGFKFPMGRTTINLAPADVKKEGHSFDLPIAVGTSLKPSNTVRWTGNCGPDAHFCRTRWQVLAGQWEG
jgi:predicted ATPase with chaperone activity